MDERELRELFRDAAHAAPQASFDEQDIIQGSRRVTARRRVAAAGGTLAAAAVLVGGVGAGTGMFDSDSSSTLSAPNQEQQEQREPGQDRGRNPEQGQEPSQEPGILMDPADPSDRGQSDRGGSGQDRSGTGCPPPDERLASALAAELPAAEGQAPRSADDCPIGARAAAFTLTEGSAKGDVSVILAPSGSVSGDQRPDPEQGGSAQATARTGSGQTLIVRSEPEQGAEAPFEARLSSLAKELAGEL